MIALIHEGLANGQQIIVFCPSRAQCHSLCKLLIEHMKSLTNTTEYFVNGLFHCKEKEKATIESIFQSRKESASKLNPVSGSGNELTNLLTSSVELGLAFHHAGLSEEERSAIESLYKKGYISVLVATSTLAAGVNLPAGRVLIKGMTIGTEQLSCVHYRQMSGRAGRTGLTSYGESFLVVKPNEKAKAVMLVQQRIPDVLSQLNPEFDGGKGILRSILELFSLGLCSSEPDVENYILQTLWYAESTPEMRDRIFQLSVRRFYYYTLYIYIFF
jgi:DNA polymerase theta